MRPLLLGTAIALFPLIAAAGDAEKDKWHCTISADRGDRVTENKDLVIEAGETVEDAIALNGNVIVRAGATVESAIALNGSVILEKGAKVKKDAVSIGGKVTAPSGSSIRGDAVAVGGSLELADKSQVKGNRVSLALKFGDSDIAQALIDNLLHGEHKCRVVSESN
jgi:NDP-sugar pyrophosphorylase family protein